LCIRRSGNKKESKNEVFRHNKLSENEYNNYTKDYVKGFGYVL